MNARSIDPVHGDGMRAVAIMFAELGHELTGTRSATPFDAVTHVARRRVAGAEGCSVTIYQDGRFKTVSATDERSRRADEIQYELGSGPCVDAIVHATLYHPEDLSQDPRWPEYGVRVSELGVASVLSYRLGLNYGNPGDGANPCSDGLVAGLNVYAGRVAAFDDAAVQTGLLLATHAAALVAAEVNREKAKNLERGFQTNRDIGVAVGILMAQNKITRTQAFDLLRIGSQNSNRKVHEIAEELIETGVLPSFHVKRNGRRVVRKN